MPFLNEDEWEIIAPYLTDDLELVKQTRKQTGIGIKEAIDKTCPVSLIKFRELTGESVEDFNLIYHHRLSNYGPECKKCGRLLRTPAAQFCADCGTERTIDQ